MRILLHDYAGHPFQIQLSRSLARRGHDLLHLYCGKLLTPRGALARTDSDPPTFEVAPIHPRRTISRKNLVRRRFQEMAYGRQVLDAAKGFRPDIVVSANAPLDVQQQLIHWCHSGDARFIFWVQDLIGVGAHRVLSRRFGLPGRVLGSYFRAYEGRLLRQSHHVVVITDDFRPMLDTWSVPPDRVTVIENWAPLDEIPTRPRDNTWSRTYGLDGKTVLLYSGTLGMKHNPSLLSGLAERLLDRDDVRVVVISEGRGAQWLENTKRERGLDNLVLLPFQPFEDLPDVLGSADVLLALLEKEAGVYCVPSKVLTSLCCQRPLLLAVPPKNLAARIVEREQAGIAVAPDDAEEFFRVARKMIDDPAGCDTMAANGRRYAETRFEVEAITDAFETVFRSV